MADKGSQGGIAIWPSEKLSSFLYDWANLFLLLALVLGAVSTAVVIWMGNNKEEYLKILLSESKERTAALERQAAELNKNTADAMERAAKAELALEQLKAPRTLSERQINSIARKLSVFKGLRVVIGAVPSSKTNTDFMDLIVDTLRKAGVDVLVNHNGVESEVSPTRAGQRGLLRSEGFPSGVSVFFTAGNTRAKAFSELLARELRRAGIGASAIGGFRDDWVSFQMAQHGTDRESQEFETVTIAIGDKPT